MAPLCFARMAAVIEPETSTASPTSIGVSGLSSLLGCRVGMTIAAAPSDTVDPGPLPHVAPDVYWRVSNSRRTINTETFAHFEKPWGAAPCVLTEARR
jgi:hypothetical protein